MSVWLNYYADRIRLMRDLGLMQLDNEGNWIDVPLEEALVCGHSEGEPAAEELELPPAVPDEWMRQAFEELRSPREPGPQRQNGPQRELWSADSRSGGAAAQLWSR